MNSQQLDLFSQPEQDNPLKNRYVCLVGDFRISQKDLEAKLIAIGSKEKKRKKEDKDDKKTFNYFPTKYVNYYVIGSNPKEDALKRIALNEHDGFHARIIDETKLYQFFDGIFTDNDFVPELVEKKISLDYSYYKWTAPTINGKNFISRVSSPLSYDLDGIANPISQLEIYVPIVPNSNMQALYQIIGNLGGYANKDYFDGTNLVLLSNETLSKLEQGIKDEIILNIENIYNKSDAIMFNVQFTCESAFINWVKQRMKVFPDESTITLLQKYEFSKQ